MCVKQIAIKKSFQYLRISVTAFVIGHRVSMRKCDIKYEANGLLACTNLQIKENLTDRTDRKGLGDLFSEMVVWSYLEE